MKKYSCRPLFEIDRLRETAGELLSAEKKDIIREEGCVSPLAVDCLDMKLMSPIGYV